MSNKKEEEEEGFWRLAALDGDRFGNEQIKLLEDLKAEEINEVKSIEVAPIFYDSIYQLSLISPKKRVSFKGTVSQNEKAIDIKYVLDRIKFDFAFIDANHNYNDVKADFELVKSCGDLAVDR